MRALAFALAALSVAACSIGALDGFSGEAAPPDSGTGAIIDGTTGSEAGADAGGTTDALPADDGAPPTSKYHAAVAADAPVAHFPLEETSGASCASSTTTSAVCLYPADQATRGQPGIGGTKALRLDATTSTLTLTGLPGDFSGPYSFELWVRLDATAEDVHIADFMNPSSGAGDGFNLFLYLGARVRTETWMSGTLIAYGLAPTAFTAATWHHLVITHSPSPHTDLFYVDGALVESSTTKPGSPRPQVTSALTIFGFTGLVDEIAVYDKTLSSARIAAHYAAQ